MWEICLSGSVRGWGATDVWQKYCGTTGKPGGNREHKHRPVALEVPSLLDRISNDAYVLRKSGSERIVNEESRQTGLPPLPWSGSRSTINRSRSAGPVCDPALRGTPLESSSSPAADLRPSGSFAGQPATANPHPSSVPAWLLPPISGHHASDPPCSRNARRSVSTRSAFCSSAPKAS